MYLGIARYWLYCPGSCLSLSERALVFSRWHLALEHSMLLY